MAEEGAPAKSIVWLASYPKSGSTWLRAMLTNYLHEGDAPASINDLISSPTASSRWMFDEYLGLASSDLTPEEILRHQPLFQELLAADLPQPTFFKTHEALLRGAGGAPAYSPAATAGAVYLIRNPLDVAVSYTHHLNWTIGAVVKRMDRSRAAEWSARTRICNLLPHRLSTWSGHVSSWLDQTEIPTHVARYEDLLADPAGAFGAVVRFAGLDHDAVRLARAVENASFARLRAQEEETGFVEKPPTARSFFRAGMAGGWRSVLEPAQVRVLVDAHGPVMERFGYLRDAEAFLAESGGAAGAAPPYLVGRQNQDVEYGKR